MTRRTTAGVRSGRKTKSATGSAQREGPTKADVQTLAVMLDLLHERAHRKRVAPGTRLALALTRDERNLILHNWSVSGGLSEEQLEVVEETGEPVLSMTLADWGEFRGWVAGTGNHARSGSSLRSRADRFFDRIQVLLDSYTDQ